MSESRREPAAAADPFAEAAEPLSREAFLCYCREVTQDDFRHGVWRAPDRPFTALCAELGVGMKCTACLLNAENLYYAARKDRPADYAGEAKAEASEPLWSRRRLYALADAIAPSVGIVSNEVVPLLAGPGVSTTLTVANSVSTAIGSRSAPFRNTARVYDAEGKLAGTRSFAVAPGERVDLTVSDLLNGGQNTDDFVLGSCWLSRQPQGPGYRGSIRGHFSVRTPRATTAVHAQEAQKSGSRTFMTSRLNPDERQYVSLVNCGSRASDVTVSVSLLHGSCPSQDIPATIPVRGSVLVPLPRLGDGGNDHIHVVTIASEQRSRYHLLIRSSDGEQLSMDHV